MHKILQKIRPVMVITRREVRDQLRDWRIIIPVLFLTIFFPYLMNFTAQQMLDFVSQYGASVIGERLVPFLLMIVGFFPISVSLVIALETFVGEKERGSIEPLLNTPLEDWQLYLGKLLSSVVPPLVASYLGMTVYLAGLAIKNVPLPEFPMLAQIFALTTVQAVVMVSGAVVVSSQATSVRATNLLASFIVIPVAFLIQGESVVMFWGNYDSLWWVVAGLVILTFLLMRVGLAHFQREELLGREIDVLNIKWMWRTFWQAFVGGAQNVWSWFRQVMSEGVKELRFSIAAMTVIGAVGIWLGTSLVKPFYFSLGDAPLENLQGRLDLLTELFPIFGIGPVLMIWWQNVRVMILAMILGVFSIGVLGTLPLFASMGVAGYLGGLLTAQGLPLSTYLLFLLPHGVIEIPAVIIGSAAVLQMGLVQATPNADKTVGEVWLMSLAKWLRVMLGVVIPLLLIAAAVEAWVTPLVLKSLV
jgi:uncharacterized membrane protein SpoIIM required for sporulation/ABC-type transport system involved in multi-copper enzyme maturation permease subunit